MLSLCRRLAIFAKMKKERQRTGTKMEAETKRLEEKNKLTLTNYKIKNMNLKR